MFTEYVFENRKYDVALRDVKSILFDIVMSEQEKVTAIISKVKTTGDKSLQDKLIVLCNEQGECLRNLLEISNSFSENLQMLDSYSRELKRIENKNIANIITGMRKDNSSMMKKGQNAAKEQVSEEGMEKAVDKAAQNPEIPNLLTPSPELAKAVSSDKVAAPNVPQMDNPIVPGEAGQTPPVEAGLPKPGLATPPNMANPAPSIQYPMDSKSDNPLAKKPEAGLIKPPKTLEEIKAELGLTTPDTPKPAEAATPAAPEIKPEAPAATPAAPEIKPEAPAATPAAPEVKPEAPAATPAAPEVKPETPAATPSAPEAASPAKADDAPAEINIEATKEAAKNLGIELPDNLNISGGKIKFKAVVADEETTESEEKSTEEEKNGEETKPDEEKTPEETKEEEKDKPEEQATEEKKEEVLEDKKEEKEDNGSVIKLPLIEDDNKENTDNESKILKKHSTEEAKAILTSAKQVGKLRDSRENQEKELTENGFLEKGDTSKTVVEKDSAVDTPAAPQPTGVIPQIIPKINPAPANNEAEKEQMMNEPKEEEKPQVKAA